MISILETIKKLLIGLTNQYPRAGIMVDIIGQVLASQSRENEIDIITSFESDTFRDVWSGPLENQIDPWLRSFWPETSWDPVP